MALPLLPLRATGTSSALDEPDVVSSIVEQVAAGHVEEACRLAVRWCGLTKDRRAQCDGNQGYMWRQLAGVVFPTARAPTPADGAHGYKPKDAQSAVREWFYYLCKQMKAMKERREDYAYAKLEWEEYLGADHDEDEEEHGELNTWKRRWNNFIMYQRKLARLEERVRTAGHEYPQDAAERTSTLKDIELMTEMMHLDTQAMSKRERHVLTTLMRFQVQQEHMDDLFQFPKPELEPDVTKANEAWSRQRKDIAVHLQKEAGPEWADRRDSAQRFAVHRDSKDPREAGLTALVSAAEARLNTTPMAVTHARVDSAEQAVLRGALNDLKYARYVGRTLRAHLAEINRKKRALERALAPLLD